MKGFWCMLVLAVLVNAAYAAEETSPENPLNKEFQNAHNERSDILKGQQALREEMRQKINEAGENLKKEVYEGVANMYGHALMAVAGICLFTFSIDKILFLRYQHQERQRLRQERQLLPQTQKEHIELLQKQSLSLKKSLDKLKTVDDLLARVQKNADTIEKYTQSLEQKEKNDMGLLRKIFGRGQRRIEKSSEVLPSTESPDIAVEKTANILGDNGQKRSKKKGVSP